MRVAEVAQHVERTVRRPVVHDDDLVRRGASGDARVSHGLDDAERVLVGARDDGDRSSRPSTPARHVEAPPSGSGPRPRRARVAASG